MSPGLSTLDRVLLFLKCQFAAGKNPSYGEIVAAASSPSAKSPESMVAQAMFRLKTKGVIARLPDMGGFYLVEAGPAPEPEPKETIMNESEKLLKRIAERFEHAEYVKTTVTERQVVDLLVAAHYLFKAEDGTMRVNPNLYGRMEKR